MSTQDIYFANKPAEERANVLLQKSSEWFQNMSTSGYLEKIRMMWAAYHGCYYDSSHTINFGGEQGELVQLGVNHLRNIAQHMLNMITATRPTMQARSVNTDYKSLVQTKLANGLLDYYMRDHRLETYLKTAVEQAIVMGSGYIKVEWNATSGEVYDFNEELGVDIKEGDLEFSNLSVFDVYFDTSREDQKHDWVVCRTFKNRYDMAAKYPEKADEILRLPTKDKLDLYGRVEINRDQTDLIAVYEFYHKRTDAVPEGKYQLYLDNGISLMESAIPYRSLPVYCIAPSYYLGTPFAYTPMFDLLGIQDAINSLYSTVLTNQTAFGVQSIAVPMGSNVNISQLDSGLQIVEYNMQQGGEIKPIQLTQTPKEIFDFIVMLEKAAETISGVSAVSRGNPDPNLRSGTSLALVQSMTLQYISGLQQSYVSLIEDLGTGIVNILKDHANVPRIAAIVGKNNKTELKEFKGDDLSSINRVVVDIGNPLARTTAGRVEMAEQLLQMGAIKTPEQYFMVIDTGQLDVLTEDTMSQLYLIKAENERMVSGQAVIALMTDEHSLHIKEHASVLADPELRFDGELFKRVSEHMQEHIELLKTTDPNLLAILGQQSLVPAPMPQMPPQTGVGGGSNAGPALSQQMGGAPMAPTALEQMGVPPINLPPLPKVDANLLSNPALQEANLGNVAPAPLPLPI